MKRLPRLPVVVVAAAAIAGAIAGTTVARSTASGSETPSAVESFSVFGKPAPRHSEPQIADLATALGADRGDLGRLRVLKSGLGPFDSRVVAFPTRSGRTICYALLGRDGTDPAASYCYQPRNPRAHPKLLGEHFSVMALYSYVNEQPGVQLFGIAFDDVRNLRVQVAGGWRNVPLGNNGFYLDLPGVTHEQVGLVEATLADGTRQVHDVQEGA